MVVSFVGLSMLLFQIIWTIKDIEKGTKLSIIFLLIGPNIFGISYELISVFCLLICWLLFDRQRRLINTPLGFYEKCAMLIVCSNIVMTMIYSNTYQITFNLIGILGVIRVFVAIYIYKIYFAKDGFEKLKEILIWVVMINAIVVIIQMTIPSTVNLFYKLYWKSSLTPLDTMVKLGYFSRAFGTYGTPLYLSLIVLLSFIFFFYLWLTEKKWGKWAVLCAISMICCFLSYSKTSYFGLVIIIVVEYILVLSKKRGCDITIKTGLLFLCFVVIITTLLAQAKDNLKLQYYLKFFKDPLSVFDTRYGDQGNLKELVEVFKSNWLFGVGISAIQGEFVGDSSYYVALHDGGVFLLAIYLILFGNMTIKAIRRKDIVCITIMLIYFLIGFGTVIFTNFIGAIYVGFVLARQNCKRRSMYEKNIALC